MTHKADIKRQEFINLQIEQHIKMHGGSRTQEVTADDKEHSQWYDRNTLWLYSRA